MMGINNKLRHTLKDNICIIYTRRLGWRDLGPSWAGGPKAVGAASAHREWPPVQGRDQPAVIK